VPALRLARFDRTFTVVDEVNVPLDAALSQPPLVELDQFKACGQSPDALIVTFCETGLDCPAVPCKASVDDPETVQAMGVTVRVTLTAFEPELLFTVNVPL
jgi:hypothetical protein